MTSSFTLAALLGTLLVVSTIPDAASYSKYGRTCKDIGCRKDEVCVMAEDPCTIYERDNCGRYPTCEKSRPGEASCASIVCQENEYCRTENGVPTCVKRTAANATPSRRPVRVRPAPTPPPRSSSFGRRTGASGSRNTIGDGSIYNRLFGEDRVYGSRGRTTTTPRTRTQQNGYYNSHTSVDAQGNRVWTFSG